MKIMYFGYGNHAKRIRSVVTSFFGSRESLSEFAIKKNISNHRDEIPVFSSLGDAVEKCGRPDVAFIITPNNLHLDAFKLCLELYVPYIYIEKPAIGIEDYYVNYLDQGGTPLKYLAVGYHFLKNPAFIGLKSIIDSKVYGEPVSLNIATGHGLAFKSTYSDSWRAKGRAEVASTAASHLISLLHYLFEGKSISQCHQCLSSWASPSLPDTYHGYFTYVNGTTASLVSSWAIPLTRKCSVIFTDGVWEYDFEAVNVSSPRDTFDENGFFVRPSSICKPLPFEGINPSIVDFLFKSSSGEYYPPFFAFSREVADLINQVSG